MITSKEGSQKTIKKILVPVDFSTSNQLAINYALMLSETFAAEVHLLHALNLSHYVMSSGAAAGGQAEPLLDAARENANINMSKIVDKLSQQGYNPITHIEVGLPRDVIVAKAEVENFDMVVMYSHGITGLARWFFGSVAEQVARKVSCPILIVKDKK